MVSTFKFLISQRVMRVAFFTRFSPILILWETQVVHLVKSSSKCNTNDATKRCWFRIPKNAHLVLNIHCAHAMEEEEIDDSGLRLYLTRQKPTYEAGLAFLDQRNLHIPPGVEVHNESIACTSKSRLPIRLFGFQTHTHEVGSCYWLSV